MLDISSKTANARVPVTVISIKGNIDSSNFKNFQEYVDKQVEDGARYVLLNFEGSDYISSAGLRVVHNLFNNLRSMHKDVNDDELRKKMSAGEYKAPYLKLTGLAPNVADVFSMGGFDIYIETLDGEAAALSSF